MTITSHKRQCENLAMSQGTPSSSLAPRQPGRDGRSPRAPGTAGGGRAAPRRRPGRLIAGLPPLRIPALDLVTVGHREPRRTLVLEALVELVPGRIARLGCRQRSCGETAQDQQSAAARSIVVDDDKSASRVHGGLDLEVAAPGHIGSSDLDVLGAEQAQVIAGLRCPARVVRVDQATFDDYALRRINQHLAADGTVHGEGGVAPTEDVSRRTHELPVLGTSDTELTPPVAAVGVEGDARVMPERSARRAAPRPGVGE